MSGDAVTSEMPMRYHAYNSGLGYRAIQDSQNGTDVAVFNPRMDQWTPEMERAFTAALIVLNLPIRRRDS